MINKIRDFIYPFLPVPIRRLYGWVRRFVREILAFLRLGSPTRLKINTRENLTRFNFSQSAAFADAGVIFNPRYSPVLLKKQMDEMLRALNISETVRGKRIVIKLNIVAGMPAVNQSIQRFGIPPIETYWVHPVPVRAYCELLKDYGASEIILVEALAEKAVLKVGGFDRLTKQLNLTFIDLNFPDPYPDFGEFLVGANPFIYKSFQLNRIFQECDTFVSFAKLKRHTSMGVTLTMKNLIGILPLAPYVTNRNTHRSAIHELPNGNADLSKVVMDIVRARPIDFGIIDGILSSVNAQGPWHDNFSPALPGILIASSNPVTADAVGTASLGGNPCADDYTFPFDESPNHLKMAADLGLGTNDPSKIKIHYLPS